MKKKKGKFKSPFGNAVAAHFAGKGGNGVRPRTQVHKAANKYCRKRNKKGLDRDCPTPFFIGNCLHNSIN
ncbi:hypothetical protein [Nonlabens sp.]|uniref:hypothetical protein n=1 Tax=Nonlabens sp. TaxID=1888209 RepID=UPI0025DBF7FB|nr:hypothetical protein [Nonlabens sp.]